MKVTVSKRFWMTAAAFAAKAGLLVYCVERIIDYPHVASHIADVAVGLGVAIVGGSAAYVLGESYRASKPVPGVTDGEDPGDA